MKGKIIVCRCEDVTLKDIKHSIERGYADIEEVKRYTGFGTGPCQGKECSSLIAGIIAEHTNAAPSTIAPFTSRPPLAPTPLKFFVNHLEPAASGDAPDDDSEEHG
jgi:sarcosine oxidase subunit beta